MTARACTGPRSRCFSRRRVGIHLSIGQQLALLATMLFTSKGGAGVAGSAIVILATTLSATERDSRRQRRTHSRRSQSVVVRLRAGERVGQLARDHRDGSHGACRRFADAAIKAKSGPEEVVPVSAL